MHFVSSDLNNNWIADLPPLPPPSHRSHPEAVKLFLAAHRYDGAGMPGQVTCRYTGRVSPSIILLTDHKITLLCLPAIPGARDI